jgi:hypothetical protein
VLLPDIPAELIEALPTALDMARQNLEPGDPGEVMAALSTLASRRGFPLPNGLALEPGLCTRQGVAGTGITENQRLAGKVISGSGAVFSSQNHVSVSSNGR